MNSLISSGCQFERHPLAIYLIINGPLGMSAGKIAAQSFQAAQRLFAAAADDADLADLLQRWQKAGTCTKTRIALSPAVFDRACRELPGVIMVDEGMTEVDPGSATCFATYPLDEAEELPRMLRHKRMPVLNASVTHISADIAQRKSGGIYSPTVEGSTPSVCVAPHARVAQPLEHRPSGAEDAGSNPAAGLALSSFLTEKLDTLGHLAQTPGDQARAGSNGGSRSRETPERGSTPLAGMAARPLASGV